MAKLFSALADRDPTFLERFAALPRHGKVRRYLARVPEELYPGRPDIMVGNVLEIRPGWWLGTHYSVIGMTKISKLACDVAGLRFGEDVRVNLG